LTYDDEVEVVLIFFGSSTCPASNDSAIPKLFRELKLKISKYANNKRISFQSIGISVDNDMNSGFNFLNKIDDFDEISIGSVRNLALQKYIQKNNLTISPQILIVVRMYSLENPLHKQIIDNELIVHKAIGAYGMYLTNYRFQDIELNLNNSLIKRDR
jgi:hypothetical protein